jgi:hypothetical protein
MELVLLDGLFSEGDNLLFGLSLVLWKGHPLANDFAARLVVCFPVRGSLFSGRRPAAPAGAHLATTSTTFLDSPYRAAAALGPRGTVSWCFPSRFFIGSRRACDHG